ncbi:hypothetical protein TorRG33x02_002700 [Trema orientale]|uniref:Uncharacterized protein n=1 Tax=Trema orientale TaxID=63057 RepID=A0A2P5G1R2_TREOI|nr:hypothetical protein TorRG33x02_002700 [Trema orientale]
MSVSIEALAMFGSNYADLQLNSKDLEAPPPHLRVEAFKRDMHLFSTNFCSSDFCKQEVIFSKDGKIEEKPIMRKLRLIEASVKNMIKIILNKLILVLRK